MIMVTDANGGKVMGPDGNGNPILNIQNLNTTPYPALRKFINQGVYDIQQKALLLKETTNGDNIYGTLVEKITNKINDRENKSVRITVNEIKDLIGNDEKEKALFEEYLTERNKLNDEDQINIGDFISRLNGLEQRYNGSLNLLKSIHLTNIPEDELSNIPLALIKALNPERQTKESFMEFYHNLGSYISMLDTDDKHKGYTILASIAFALGNGVTYITNGVSILTLREILIQLLSK